MRPNAHNIAPSLGLGSGLGPGFGLGRSAGDGLTPLQFPEPEVIHECGAA